MSKTANLTYSAVADAASRINTEGARRSIEDFPAYMDSDDLEELTGTPASTWRFWSLKGWGPASFKIGRRRVWRRSVVERWLAEQEQQAGA